MRETYTARVRRELRERGIVPLAERGRRVWARPGVDATPLARDIAGLVESRGGVEAWFEAMRELLAGTIEMREEIPPP